MSRKKKTCRNCKNITCERRWDKRIMRSLKGLIYSIEEVFPECDDPRVELWLQDALDEIIARNCIDYKEYEQTVIQHTFFKPEKYK